MTLTLNTVYRAEKITSRRKIKKKNEPKMKSRRNEDFQKILKGGIIRYE
jgi:hypothetical protein